MVDPKTIKQLVRLMTENDLTELDLEEEGQKIRLRRGAPPGSFAPGSFAPAPAPVAVQASPAPAAASGGGAGAAPEAAKEELPGAFIRSPMVGSFYSASSPDAAPFLKVGDKVAVDDVVCIIEAMKVFNEIKAEVAGVVAEVLVTNGQTVEFDQPLFRLK